jgi:hypothetical protein
MNTMMVTSMNMSAKARKPGKPQAAARRRAKKSASKPPPRPANGACLNRAAAPMRCSRNNGVFFKPAIAHPHGTMAAMWPPRTIPITFFGRRPRLRVAARLSRLAALPGTPCATWTEINLEHMT